MKKFISEHTLITRYGRGYVLFYNLLLRKGVAAEPKSLETLYGFIENEKIENVSIQFADISCFSLSECLLDNPAGISKGNVALKPAPASEFVRLLVEYSMLSENTAYLRKAGKKKNIFDSFHTGNFHQDIGRFMMESKKMNPEEWWIYQKFDKNLRSLHDTPYLWVQKKFLEKFFPKDFKGKKILDFGCGIGYYSEFFRKRNANVTGIDPSPLYIKLARKKFAEGKNLIFKELSFETVSDFKLMGDDKYDIIYLSDVLLYYFEPYKKLDIKPQDLLGMLRKHMNPGGSIYVMDPHGCFHLQPWMGETMPFMLCGEYRHRKYRVTPSLMEFSMVAEKSGLYINRIRELYSEGKHQGQNRKITAEFPLWWLFELKAR